MSFRCQPCTQMGLLSDYTLQPTDYKDPKINYFRRFSPSNDLFVYFIQKNETGLTPSGI